MRRRQARERLGVSDRTFGKLVDAEILVPRYISTDATLRSTSGKEKQKRKRIANLGLQRAFYIGEEVRKIAAKLAKKEKT